MKPTYRVCRDLASNFLDRRRLNSDINLGLGSWSLGFPVPSRYPVSPPNLSANAPIANVFQPLSVNFFPMPRKEANEMIPHHGERFFCFRVTQKPLLADARFYWNITPLTEADVVLVRLRF